MHIPALPNKLQQKLCPLFLSIGPGLAFGRHTSIRTRMHQRLYRFREKTVDDKEILFDSELWVEAFKIAGMVVLNAMTQYQVLSASGRTDRVSLNKAESVESRISASWA